MGTPDTGYWRKFWKTARFLKYLVILLVLVIIVLSEKGCQDEAKWHETWTTLKNEAIPSTLSALALALLYDIFLRNEQNAERKDFSEDLITNIAKYVDVKNLDKGVLTQFVGHAARSDKGMNALCRVFVDDPIVSALSQRLNSLPDYNILYDVTVTNKLSQHTAPGSYKLEMKQEFKLSRPKKQILVVITSDRRLADDIAATPDKVDFLAWISEKHWGDGDSPLPFTSLQLIHSKPGAPERVPIPPHMLSARQLHGSVHRIGKAEKFAKGFSFVLPDDSQALGFELIHETIWDFSMPYYWWAAENPMVVNKIAIEYGAVAHEMIDPDPSCFIGNVAGEPQQTRESYTVPIKGLIWPGQGVKLAWKLPPVSQAANPSNAQTGS